MASETTVAVEIGGEDNRPITLSDSGVRSKVIGEVKNVLNFIKGLWSGRNRQVSPPRKDNTGSEAQCPDENPIRAMMESQELGKTLLQIAFAMTGIVVSVKGDTLSPTVAHITLLANMTGITAIWTGILHRKKFPTTASVLEQVGVLMVFSSLFTFIANFLPPELRFLVVIHFCFFLACCVQGIIRRGGTDQQGGKKEGCPV